jgi:glycosyltransferase involved in cell wall biosynthesis
LKILHVYKDYYPPIQGGIEKTINFLCQNLKNDYEIEVLVANRAFKTQIDIVDGIKVYKVADFGRVLSAPMSLIFPYWLGKIKADILHFHLPNPTAVVSYLIRRPSGKVVVTWHSDIIRQKKFLIVYKHFLYRFLDMVDVIIGTSQRYIDTSPHLERYPDKCVAIPLGIVASEFDRTPRIDRESRKIREQFGDRIVLFVGLLRYYKGVQYLIKAMQNVDGCLLIVGTGPMDEELKNLTNELKLNEKVHFIGAIDDDMKLDYLHACQVFCLPSILRSEGFGLSQLEAFACGKPIVSTNLDTGVPYVNLHGVTGTIVEPYDVNALTSALNRLLDDPDLCKRYGEEGRKRVQTEFSSDRIVQLTKGVYERLFVK